MGRLSRVNNKETFIKENITFYSQAEIYPSLRQTEIEKSPINFTSRDLFRILPFQHFTAFTLFSTMSLLRFMLLWFTSEFPTLLILASPSSAI